MTGWATRPSRSVKKPHNCQPKAIVGHPPRNMKFRLCNFFVRLGSAPIEKNNFLSIEQRRSDCVVRVAAFAEQFYVALGFYMEVSEGMRGTTDSCWFELQRRTRKRLPREVLNDIAMAGYTQRGALYGDVGSDEISALVNEFWLGDQFRMIVTSRTSATTAVQLTIALGERPLHEEDTGSDRLPTSVIFVLEKQYFTGEPFLVLLIGNSNVNLTRELISRAAVRLQRPLLEVGPGAWPPVQYPD